MTEKQLSDKCCCFLQVVEFARDKHEFDSCCYLFASTLKGIKIENVSYDVGNLLCEYFEECDMLRFLKCVIDHINTLCYIDKLQTLERYFSILESWL